ncbi:protein phosphatase [Propionispira arboris]|uniref:Protein phosphatase n=1 Tax=Propionispira arboris TaxID=84035 RepID=A0A1H6WB31_9FIRM|nr:Stp1/IreP family PP2C-type Ser/Thr phosphatase [Propionispira arboris]SEJ11267.1 protein phosphatase [Propionispira arboris]
MLKITASTNIGLIRQTNEDSYVCINPKTYAVADGMGGHAAGEIASNLLINTIEDFFSEKFLITIDQDVLEKIILKANERILEKAKNHTEYAGMGTTASLLHIEADTCFWAHIGDSRIYLLRNNKLAQITQDHSLVWDLVLNGTLTQEEALVHPQRNMLTRAVGIDADVKVDKGSFALEKNDKFLLCTDGLTNMVNETEVKKIIESETIDDKAAALIDQALRAGGVDNITAIILENNDD